MNGRERVEAALAMGIDRDSRLDRGGQLPAQLLLDRGATLVLALAMVSSSRA